MWNELCASVCCVSLLFCTWVSDMLCGKYTNGWNSIHVFNITSLPVWLHAYLFVTDWKLPEKSSFPVLIIIMPVQTWHQTPSPWHKLLSKTRLCWETKPLCVTFRWTTVCVRRRPSEGLGGTEGAELRTHSRCHQCSTTYCLNACTGLQSVSFYRGAAQLMQSSPPAHRGAVISCIHVWALCAAEWKRDPLWLLWKLSSASSWKGKHRAKRGFTPPRTKRSENHSCLFPPDPQNRKLTAGVSRLLTAQDKRLAIISVLSIWILKQGQQPRGLCGRRAPTGH